MRLHVCGVQFLGMEITNFISPPFVIFPLLTEDGAPRINPDNVLDQRDTQYDAMLSQMVGRIKSKPGGKLETGEVSYWDSFLLFVNFFSLNSLINESSFNFTAIY